MYHYSKPTISEKDIENVVKVLRSEYLTQGPITNEFERKLEEKFGSSFAITCNSGTSALHMTYQVLGLGPEKGLVTSAITFMATANAAKMCNADTENPMRAPAKEREVMTAEEKTIGAGYVSNRSETPDSC